MSDHELDPVTLRWAAWCVAECANLPFSDLPRGGINAMVCDMVDHADRVEAGRHRPVKVSEPRQGD